MTKEGALNILSDPAITEADDLPIAVKALIALELSPNEEKWEYLQLHDEAPAIDTEELNKWGAQGWQLCMAYVLETPVAVLPGTVTLAPGQMAVRRARVYVYKRPLKSVQP